LDALAAAAEASSGVSLFRALQGPIDGLTERARKALSEFRSIVEKISVAAETLSAAEAVEVVLSETGLRALYAESTDPQDEARRENLDQLLAAAQEHDRLAGNEEAWEPGIAGFLDAVTLRSDGDEAEEKKGVLLMTLHSAKGLEFEEVFLAGMEDGFLPHFSSKDDEDQQEEERRLAYVGMTRAKDRLTLSAARRRMIRGEWVRRDRSPFLEDIPAETLRREDLTVRRFDSHGGHGADDSQTLFPDYEGESQEQRPSPPRRSGAPPPSRLMRRTPPPPTASGFRRGAKVRHPEYGIGVVLSIEGSGDAERVTVYFDRHGKKKFVARFANISPA
jgi:DNA helicase-2/ATP-dependent DNA helicase PcrA